MIPRRARGSVEQALEYQAAVALIGPRQVGKTTLAVQLAEERGALYLDLEDRADRIKLQDPRHFLEPYEGRLVVLDEIHRAPEILPDLRGLIDRGRRRGARTGRFLLLGSASLDLMRRAGETLAGRIAPVDLGPLDVLEAPAGEGATRTLWIRGGFPDSFLAADDAVSLLIRKGFIRTFLEREVAWLVPRLPIETLSRLWTMLAHSQGALLNAARLGGALGVSAQTTNRYLGLLTDLLLLRRLPPFHANTGKRLVKSPRIYIRDSGLCHALLDLENWNDIAGHPVAGASWEGFVIENLLSAAPDRTHASFYRTAAGAEMDLVLDLPDGRRWTVEVKLGLTPSVSRGFHEARAALEPDRSFIVYSGGDRYRLANGAEVVGLPELAGALAARSRREDPEIDRHQSP